MGRPLNTLEQAKELRQRAADLALRRATPPSADPESSLPAWVLEVLHGLRANQIDLELQNEELRRSASSIVTA